MSVPNLLTIWAILLHLVHISRSWSNIFKVCSKFMKTYYMG